MGKAGREQGSESHGQFGFNPKQYVWLTHGVMNPRPHSAWKETRTGWELATDVLQFEAETLEWRGQREKEHNEPSRELSQARQA